MMAPLPGLITDWHMLASQLGSEEVACWLVSKVAIATCQRLIEAILGAGNYGWA
jgi:hypothetical protein